MIVRKRHLALLTLLMGLLLGLVIFLYWYNPVVSVRIKSSRFPGQVTLNPREKEMVVRELEKAAPLSVSPCPVPHYILEVNRKQGQESFVIDEGNLVYDAQQRRVQVSQEFLGIIKSLQKKVQQETPFGEMVAWEEADKLFPKYAKARVQDVDTGLSFWVQRRAGRNHADVQPLTAKDSQTMKKIYNGRWSWKRKAIVIWAGKRKLAASMNGMPHGAGAIAGNDFKGHFCIHFYKCKTHSGNVNLEHQLMVWKAANKFEEMTRTLDVRKTLEVFFTAVDQGELKLAGHFFNGGEKDLMKLLQQVEWITLKELKPQESDGGKERLVEISLEMGLRGGPVRAKREGSVLLVKNNGSPRWVVRADSLEELFEEKQSVGEN